MTRQNLVIIGAGSHGRGIKHIVDEINANTTWGIINFKGFLDDDLSKTDVDGPISKDYSETEFVIGINDSKIRSEIIKHRSPTLIPGEPLIHPKAFVGKNCTLGDGVVIQAGAILTGDVVLGDHVHVNVGATISQGSALGDFSTVAPGAHIAGEVTVGKRVQIGAGAIIINLLDITSDIIIGAGAVVVKSIQERGTYVGVPVRKVK